MTREEAIRALLPSVPPDALVVASNGFTSRALHAALDRPAHFYMIGSMGLAPSIALGVALADPGRPVVVLDGDGNVLMNLGELAQVAVRRPARFTHVCLDNGRHASTGGQRTIAVDVDLAAVAATAGYAWTARAEAAEELATSAAAAFAAAGPAFLLVRVIPGGLPPGTARVALAPRELTARTRAFLADRRAPR